MKYIRECQAPVIAHISAQCCSAAADMALACDEWEVDDFSQMLLHNVQYGLMPQKEQDVLDYVSHKRIISEQMAKELYAGFLTDEEINQLLYGRQFWFNSEQIIERLENLTKHRESKLAEEIEKQREAIADAVKNEEESEIDLNDPTTWPDGSKVKLKKSIGIFKRGLTLNLSQIHSREITREVVS